MYVVGPVREITPKKVSCLVRWAWVKYRNTAQYMYLQGEDKADVNILVCVGL